MSSKEKLNQYVEITSKIQFIKKLIQLALMRWS